MDIRTWSLVLCVLYREIVLFLRYVILNRVFGPSFLVKSILSQYSLSEISLNECMHTYARTHTHTCTNTRTYILGVGHGETGETLSGAGQDHRAAGSLGDLSSAGASQWSGHLRQRHDKEASWERSKIGRFRILRFCKGKNMVGTHGISNDGHSKKGTTPLQHSTF